MNAKDLYDEWKSGESTGLRPARLQQVRDDLSEAIDLPVPRHRSALDSWQERMKSQITKKLKDAAEEDDAE